MELVYLWVEDYKNIKRQGFNFSPRFACEYEDGTLDITDKEETGESYLKDFFGENINVTAIVGENGSGKSNIFEAILSNFMENGIPIDENYKILSVFNNSLENKLYYKSLEVNVDKINGENLLESIATIGKYEIENIDEINTFTLYYNYGLDWIFNTENNLDFNKIYHKQDGYNTPFLLQPNKSDNKIHLSNIDYLATRDILNFIIQRGISFDFIDDFFTPTKCKLKFTITDITKDENNIFYKKINPLWNTQSAKEEYIYLSYIYIIRKTFATANIKYSILKDLVFQNKFIKEKLTIGNIDSFIDYMNDKEFDDIYDDSINYKTHKIKQCFLFIKYLEGLSEFDFSLLQDKIINLEENKELLKNLAPWIQVEFFNDKDISFYSLSYGQKFLVKFLYNLLNQLNNLTSHPEYKNIIILIDEVELGLHPQWQKKYLSILLKVLKTKIEGFDFNYNIFCATHSPFILSDLPKENVIFLKNGKQDKSVDINPFGANIHTLLSHGFFMKDGLMGEFAKGKINTIIQNLNDKEYTLDEEDKKQLLLTINSIGEEFLKLKLLDMYYKKFDDALTKKQHKEELLRKQAEIKMELEQYD